MLELVNFSKSYGNKLAVDNISLKVESGDIYAFVGPNGAGKTTTLKSISGILDFDDGDILIDNISIKSNPLECKKIMAYLPDNPDLYEFLKGIDYLNFICDIYEVKEREEIIKKYSDLFELTGFLGNTINTYSHGMKQKLAVIASLIHKPKLLILDEPFVGLDPISAHNLQEVLKKLTKEEGMAVLFSTHVLEVAEKLCNKVAIIKEGKLIVSGNIKKVLKDKSLVDLFLEQVHE